MISPVDVFGNLYGGWRFRGFITFNVKRWSYSLVTSFCKYESL